jgi:hypothetical protein
MMVKMFPMSSSCVLLFAALCTVAAQNNTLLIPKDKTNVNGGDVFTNYVNLRDKRQAFLKGVAISDFETPGGDPVPGEGIVWISDAVFSDFNFGYAARGITMFAKNWINKDAIDTPPLQEPRSVSAVYVEQLNIFDAQLHFEDAVIFFQIWDDGQNKSQAMGWASDLRVNGSKAFSAAVMYHWLTAEEAAIDLNTTADMLTPEKFDEMYARVWNSYRKRTDVKENASAAASSIVGVWDWYGLVLVTLFPVLLW